MSKLTIPELLRRTWGLSCTRPALAAFAVLLVISLAGVFGPTYYLSGEGGGSIANYSLFSLALGLVRGLAVFVIIILLSRRLLRDGGVNHPPRWLRCIALLIVYAFILRIFSALLPLFLVSYWDAKLFLYANFFATAVLRFLLLPFLVRAVLLAGGEAEPRLGAVWSKLWGGHSRSALGYLVVLLVFAALAIASIEFGSVFGSGGGSYLQMGVGGLIEAIGQIAAIACLIAIAQSLLSAAADEVEVFS